MIRKSIPWLIVFLSCITPAFASQEAWVSIQNAPVVREPVDESEVMSMRFAGQHVRVSSASKNGWYKIRNEDGTYGWIHHKHLTIGNDSQALQASGFDMKTLTSPHVPRTRDYVFVKPQIASLIMYAANIGGYYYSYPVSLGIMVDGAYAFSRNARVVLRAGYYQSGSGSNEIFEIKRAGIPLLTGIEFALSRANRLHHSLNVLGGADFANYTLTAKRGAPAEVGVSLTTPMVWISYTLKTIMGKHSMFTFDIGGFYGLEKNSRIENAPWLADAASPDTIKTRFSGITLSVGAEWGFLNR